MTQTVDATHSATIAHSATTPGAHRRRQDIQGLRAVAVMLVIPCHAGVSQLAGGYVGVDVFFVVSGFIITDLLLREQDGTGVSLLTFYGRRARRILPAATVVLVVTVAASYRFLGFIHGAAIARDGEWTSAFLANFHFAQQGADYLNAQAPPSPLQHYWSLAVEEQFYLVWPAVLVLVATTWGRVGLRVKLGALLLVTTALSFGWSAIETTRSGTSAYYSPLTRACELSAGAALAVAVPLLQRIPAKAAAALTWLGLSGIVAAATLYDSATIFPGIAVALPVLATTAVIAGGTAYHRQGAGLILDRRLMQWLGDVSYSLYLWHWPLLIIAAERTNGVISPRLRATLVAAAIVLAALTYYLIERPVRGSRSLSRRPLASIAVGLVLVAVAFGTSAWQLSSHPHVQSVTDDGGGL